MQIQIVLCCHATFVVLLCRTTKDMNFYAAMTLAQMLKKKNVIMNYGLRLSNHGCCNASA